MRKNAGECCFIFEKEVAKKEDLKAGMKISIKILGIARQNDYFEKNVFIHRDLRSYSSTSLRMTILKKYAEPLGLQDGDIVNIEIIDKK